MVNPLLDGAVEMAGEVVRADLINRRADEVPGLLIQEHEEAALLIAWSALEGALRSREVRRGTPSLTKRLNIKDLYSTGLLTQGQFRLLEEAARLRGRIAHGYLVESPNVGEIAERVAALARKAADPEYPTVEEMIDWFFERYEDPAHRVPYDSSEGGYQYVGGGPYDAREELTEAFPNVDTEDLDGAVEQIEAEGFEWVRKDDD